MRISICNHNWKILVVLKNDETPKNVSKDLQISEILRKMYVVISTNICKNM